MLKSISRLRCSLSGRFQTPVRTVLSSNYKSAESWSQRLAYPCMKNVDVDNLYYSLDQKLQQQNKISSIDLDIFVNRIEGDGYTDEIAELLHRFRATSEASDILDSTSHAIVRMFLSTGQVEELLNILEDRLTYGVFLDFFTANMVLNWLLKKEDFKSAARVASQLMLQEDFSNEISKCLSLYACVRYLDLPKEPVVEIKVDDTPKKKKVEEVKVRVNYLRNPYFDDHFDITDLDQLVGKTLVMIGKTMDNDLGINSRLIGMAIRHQYDDCLNLMSASSPDNLFRWSLERMQQHCDTVSDKNDSCIKLIEQIQSKMSIAKGTETSFKDALRTSVEQTVAANEKDDIVEQKKVHQFWCENRDKLLQDALVRLAKAKKILDMKKLEEEMRTDEKRLWFFDNETQIDLEIESKRVFYPKRFFGKKKKPRVVDEGYIPPEVR